MPVTFSAPPASPFAAASIDDDPLAVLHDALTAAEQAGGLEASLSALLAGAQRLGLGAGAVIAHEQMTAVTLASASAPDAPPSAGEPTPVPAGAVWRRWLRLLERRQATYRQGALYALPLHDPWVRTEIGDPLCGGRGAAPGGLVLVPLTGDDGRAPATLTLDVPGAWPPPPSLLRAVEMLARYAARHIERHRLAALAERRAERLQRLYEAGVALSRSLDEREIVRELGRQVARLLPADGVVVAHPDVGAGVVRTALRVVRGIGRPRAEQPLTGGVIATVARTGASVRVDDYDPESTPLAAADDVVGDGGPAGSVLAAPMRVGTQLVGVVATHVAAMRAYAAEDEELLRTVAAQAGTAIANARLYAESEAERRQSEALAEVARAVTGSLRLGEVLRLVLRHTAGLLRAEGACVALRSDEFLHVVAGVGSAELLAGVHVPTDASMMGRSLLEGCAVISNDVLSEPTSYHPPHWAAVIDKLLIVPLRAGEEPIGVLVAMNRCDDFAEADARVLQRLGDHVGIAVANARLFEQVSSATREWKVAFDAIAGGMVVLDEQCRVVRCNARGAELLGAPGPKAVLGTAFLDALLADDAGNEVVRAAVEHGRTARGTLRSASRGSVYDVVAAPHPDGGAVVTFDDVTEHHALVERYRLFVGTAGEGE
jgi:GAF domain-containing protein